jgi:anti-sigma factor RsiW
MSKPLDERDKEDLVAFLDGELTGEEARAIERRLSLDPTARAEADTLRRTWDLLDFLPRPEPSASFTEKTLTRLSSVRAEALRPQPPWRDWRSIGFAVVWMGLLVLAMFSGFRGYKHFAPSEDKDLARHLRVIENKRYYDLVDDMTFLKKLDTPELFGNESTAP